MSVRSYLSQVSSSLVLSDDEKLSIARSATTLSERLNSYFQSQIKEDFRFGSYERGTILPRKVDSKSDVDYMVVFDDYLELQPQSYLTRLRNFVNFRYSTSDIKQSHPTIVLSLNHIHFELVPAIRDKNSLIGTLQIPSPPSDFTRWMVTYPYAANENIRSHNIAHYSLSKPLIRLLKYWNCQHYSRPFSSFELEKHVTSLQFYGCYNIKDYFFNAVENLSTGYGKSQLTQARIESLKNTVSKSKGYELNSMPYSAEEEIRKVIPVAL